MRRGMIWAIVISAAYMAADTGEDLLKNAGFEITADSGLPAGWSGPANVYGRDATVAHSGNASLKYVNTDRGVYVLCAQPVALPPGKMYEMSAWV